MTDLALPVDETRSSRAALVPPAPRPPAQPLSVWQGIRRTGRNTLAVWPERAYEQLITRRDVLGGANYLVNDPATVRKVLAARSDAYVKTTITARILRPVTGAGLFLTEGEDWRRQRKTLAPAFTPGHVDLLTTHFVAAAESFLAGVGGRINMAAALQEAALDAACRSLFSMPIGGRGQTLARLARGYGHRAGRPGLLDFMARKEDDFYWLNPGRRHFRRRWMREVDGIIAERRAMGAPGEGPRDFLDMLLQARDKETGEALADAEIRDQSSTMLAAGFETTSRAMFWTTFLLALDRDEQARVRDEIRASPPETVATLGDLGRWPRLRAVVYEAMRLYPPAPVFTRMAVQPDHLVEHDIRPGDTVMISPWVMHRHRRLWDNPDAFIPDRFEGKAQAYLADGPYLPFGAGPRICIGATFAMAEIAFVLSRLLDRFEISLDDTRTVMPRAVISTMPSIEPWFRLAPAVARSGL